MTLETANKPATPDLLDAFGVAIERWIAECVRGGPLAAHEVELRAATPRLYAALVETLFAADVS